MSWAQIVNSPIALFQDRNSLVKISFLPQPPPPSTQVLHSRGHKSQLSGGRKVNRAAAGTEREKKNKNETRPKNNLRL